MGALSLVELTNVSHEDSESMLMQHCLIFKTRKTRNMESGLEFCTSFEKAFHDYISSHTSSL